MEKEKPGSEISEEDLRAALREMRTYMDITEEDLRKIYDIALRHAEERTATRVVVGEAMTRDVISVRPDADLHEVARLISEHRVSGLPVVDEGNRVVGVVSEADILALAGLKREHTFKDLIRHLLGEPVAERKAGRRVADVMTSPAITIGPDQDIRDAADVLESRRIKRLPVVDPERRLLGVISRADIVKAISRK